MRHKTLGWIGLSALIMACAGGTVQAQAATGNGQPPAAGQARAGRQGRQGGGPVYLSDLSVETMSQGLKLTDDQKTKIQAVLDKRAADYKMLVPPPNQQGKRSAVQEVNSKRTELAQKADMDIEAVLTDDQKKVLPDYKKDLAFFREVDLPTGLIGEMKITDEQRTKIAVQVTENRRTMRRKMRDATQAGSEMPPAARTAMLKENQDKILALLTSDQRALLDKYNKDHPALVPGNPANADAKPNAPNADQKKDAGGNN